MAASPDGSSARPVGVRFTKASADRIAKAVRTVELGSRDSEGLYYDKALGHTPKVFRVCYMPSSAWNKGAIQTVTFRNVTTTPNTAAALNLFAAISTSASTARSCAIAKEGTAWYLIAAECD